MSKRARNQPKMGDPAIYRICVQGRVDPRWAGRLGGMNITESRPEGGESETTLVGRLADQAELTGILNTLYELHLPVRSVECLETG